MGIINQLITGGYHLVEWHIILWTMSDYVLRAGFSRWYVIWLSLMEFHGDEMVILWDWTEISWWFPWDRMVRTMENSSRLCPPRKCFLVYIFFLIIQIYLVYPLRTTDISIVKLAPPCIVWWFILICQYLHLQTHFMNPMPVDIAIADVDKLILSGRQIPSESSDVAP